MSVEADVVHAAAEQVYEHPAGIRCVDAVVVADLVVIEHFVEYYALHIDPFDGGSLGNAASEPADCTAHSQ